MLDDGCQCSFFLKYKYLRRSPCRIHLVKPTPLDALDRDLVYSHLAGSFYKQYTCADGWIGIWAELGPLWM